MYGVFILKSGKWDMHCSYDSIHQARNEVDYLVKKIGVKAEVFKKV